MAKISILIDETELDKQVISLIEGKIKSMIRKDTVLEEEIEELLKREIGKRVSQVLINHNIETMIQMEILKKLPSDKSIAQTTLNMITKDVKDIIFGPNLNAKVISKLFQDEIDEIKKGGKDV